MEPGGKSLCYPVMRRIEVKVKPNARESSLLEQDDGTWVARLKSPPVDGKANEELIGLIADRFSLRRSQITIKAGAASRLKRVEIPEN